MTGRRTILCTTSLVALWQCGARTALNVPFREPDGAADASSTDGQRPTGVSVVIGPYTACALVDGGVVKCWGSDWNGALGDGADAGPESCHAAPCSTSPVAVSGVSGAVALTPACALFADGTVRCWGDNSAGELGIGMTTGPETCAGRKVVSYPCSKAPVAVSGLTGATAIASGGAHTCALVGGGHVACWGNNDSGQLGIGTTMGPEVCPAASTLCATTPQAVAGLGGVTAIAGGGTYTCALLEDGTVDCWGDDTLGQLGDGPSGAPQTCVAGACSTTPRAVPGLSGITAIAAGSGHACALRSDGTVACWGANQAGQLGNGKIGPETCGTTPCARTPGTVKNLTGATAIAAGDLDTCALFAGGLVACWGDNISGELGNGMHTGPDVCTQGVVCSMKPVPVSGLVGVTAVAAGGASACAVVAGSLVECWGDNTYGELGLGTSEGPQGCSLTCSPWAVAVSGL